MGCLLIQCAGCRRGATGEMPSTLDVKFKAPEEFVSMRHALSTKDYAEHGGSGQFAVPPGGEGGRGSGATRCSGDQFPRASRALTSPSASWYSGDGFIATAIRSWASASGRRFCRCSVLPSANRA